MGCSPIKAARELGSERRETVRSSILCGRRKIERFKPYYERTGFDAPLVLRLFCQEHGRVAKCGTDKR